MKKPFANDISRRIQELVDKRGITIYGLCKRTGYDEGILAVAKARTNSFSSSRMLCVLAKELGTTVEYLVNGETPAFTKDAVVKKLTSEREEYKNKYETAMKDMEDLKKILSRN